MVILSSPVKTLWQRFAVYLREPLHRNSVILTVANIAHAGLSFIFWFVIARIQTTGEVGLASAGVSASFLLVTFSSLGLGVAAVRFLPGETSRGRLVNTVLTMSGLTSAALGVVFILGLSVWSPELLFLRDNPWSLLGFGLLTVASSIAGMQSTLFVASGVSQYSLIQSLVAGLRIAFLPALAFMGAPGILLAFGLGMALSFAATNVRLHKAYRDYRVAPLVDTSILKRLLGFSLASYLADSLKSAPGMLMPVIAVNLLSPEDCAYLFLAWTLVGNLLHYFAFSTHLSLLAQASANPSELKQYLVKAARFLFTILTPAALAFVALAGPLMSLFGPDYAQGAATPLRVFAISSLPVAAIELFIVKCRLQQRNGVTIVMYAVIAVLSSLGAVWLMPRIGVMGGAVAWGAANGLMAVVAVILLVRFVRQK